MGGWKGESHITLEVYMLRKRATGSTSERFLFMCLILGVGAAACSGGSSRNDNNNGNNVTTRCGNGEREGAEECDDGPQNSDFTPDACRTDCTDAHCGDGVVDASELCDDGPANSDEVPDACRANCTPPSCGDGVVDVQAGESCDPGPDLPTSTCSDVCRVIHCGNGTLDDGEVCDDGNFEAGDGCSPDCLSLEVCGNGYVDTARNEQCDDGNTEDGDGCQHDCRLPVCGDGVLDEHLFEECDRGADNSDTAPDACRTTCRLPRCGDGVRDATEVCDDGNTDYGDGCSGDCRSLEVCGNGITDAAAGEECDDGNLRSHDGCNSVCLAESLTWSPWQNPLAARSDHGLAYDSARDRLVLFGGQGPQGALGDTWEYDGARWHRMTPTVSPTPRAKHDMVYDVSRGVVVLFGGGGAGYLGDTWEWDGATWTQRAPTSAPSARSGHAMAYDVGRSRVVLFGGQNGTESHGMSDLWEYNGAEWTEKPSSGSWPSVRFGPALAYHPGLGEVVLFGGRGGTSWTFRSDTWRWNGTSWTAGGAGPSGRMRTAMAYDSGLGALVLFGGQGGGGTLGDAWRYDGAWAAHPLATEPSPRSGGRLAPEPGGTTLVLHGGQDELETLDDLWRLTASKWVRLYTSRPSPRASHGMVYDSLRDRVVLFGGDREGVFLDDTWILQDGTWTLVNTPLAPEARAQFGMAYDSRRDRVVVYGGWANSGSLAGGTWEFDGTHWQNNPLPELPGRSGTALAYDKRRGVVVKFGGGSSDETYEYDGTEWVLAPTSTSPPGRRVHTLVYDESLERILLFGGYSTDVFDDLWTYDGTDWTLLDQGGGPSARSFTMLFHDSARERTLLFGGDTHSGPVGDTWEWGPTGWVPVFSTFAPSIRIGHAIAYRAGGREAILLGGSIFDSALDDIWRFRYESTWPDEVCHSGADVDQDGLVDCADPDCDGVLCATGRCQGGVCTPIPWSHTLAMDGVNDFTMDETFTTSTGSFTGYVTWDTASLYLGMEGADVGAGDANRWVLAYLGGVGGTTTGALYNTQQPGLVFAARYQVRWRADNGLTELLSWDGATWSATGATVEASQNGTFVELRVPLAELGSPSLLPVHLSMINEVGLGEWSWAAMPAASFTDGYDPDYTQYLEFDLRSSSAPVDYPPLP